MGDATQGVRDALRRLAEAIDTMSTAGNVTAHYAFERLDELKTALAQSSSAGLIEAAEWLEQRAIWHETKAGHTIGEQSKHHKSAAREDSQAAKLLRARAAEGHPVTRAAREGDK